MTDDFKSVVSTPKGVYGAPLGSSQAGGIMYNKKVYEQLGLSVPTTWDGVHLEQREDQGSAASRRSSRPTATPGRAS